MGAAIVLSAVVVNVQVENAATLVDGLEIEPQAKELFGLIQWKTQVNLMVNDFDVNLGLHEWEVAFGQFGQGRGIGTRPSGAEQANFFRLANGGFPNSGVLLPPLEFDLGKVEAWKKKQTKEDLNGFHVLTIDVGSWGKIADY